MLENGPLSCVSRSRKKTRRKLVENWICCSSCVFRFCFGSSSFHQQNNKKTTRCWAPSADFPQAPRQTHSGQGLKTLFSKSRRRAQEGGRRVRRQWAQERVECLPHKNNKTLLAQNQKPLGQTGGYSSNTEILEENEKVEKKGKREWRTSGARKTSQTQFLQKEEDGDGTGPSSAPVLAITGSSSSQLKPHS